MKKLTFIISLLITLESIAQQFNIVKEINTTANQSGIFSTNFCKVGNNIFLVGTTPQTGAELWKYDVTTSTTTLVKDIFSGLSGSGIGLLTEANGLLYFTANDGFNGIELWRSDGTEAGTYIVKNIGSGNLNASITTMFYFNGTLYFPANDGNTGLELWKTNGSEAGTEKVKEINPGVGSAFSTTVSPNEFTSFGSYFYFPANNSTNGRELWKSDGTEAGTVMVKDVFTGAAGGIVNHKAAIFDNKLFFAASNGTAVNGTELWATNGTDSGTYMVKDIVIGSGNASPNNLTQFNDALFFTASSTNNSNPDLWKSDGTNAGTLMVRNLVADGIGLTVGFNNTNNSFTTFDSKLYFASVNGPVGAELYATDGTTSGTGLVKDIVPGISGSNPTSFKEFAGKLYFSSFDNTGISGRKLFATDGTSAGTSLVVTGELETRLNFGGGSLITQGSQLYFAGSTIDEGLELWKTDGTSAGTEIVYDINLTKNGTTTTGSNLFGSTTLGNYHFFAAADNANGMELWKSNGTDAGTVMVKNIRPGKGNSNPNNFFTAGNVIYFSATDETNGTELWKSDGTEAGTVMVKDIWPGSASSTPTRYTVSNGKVFFTAEDPVNGREIWMTDGTSGGTILVADVIPGNGNGINPGNDAVTVGNFGYYIAASGLLYKADGFSNSFLQVPSDINFVSDLGVLGNTLYITGRNVANQFNLWKSENGAAPVFIKMLSPTSTNAYQLTACGNKIYFNGNNGTSGQEPWVSDGTAAGTYMIKDINPGTGNSQPFQFVAAHGKIYFQASNAANNIELWATDGTEAGTYLVKDIFPGNTTNGFPSAMIAKPGGNILFIATDGVNGVELWESDGTTSGTNLKQDFNTSGDGFTIPGRFLNFSQDYLLTKINNNNNLIFFARSADKGIQLYSGSIAGNYLYVNDNSQANDAFTSAIGSNANNGSQSAPFATLTYALTQASEGDTIYVDAGSYAEQVIINKGITIIGAGQNITSFTPPVTTLVPAPGPFTEIGLFETTQGIGDVHIRHLSINSNSGSQNIIIQSGGSVTNCLLLNGGQGVFFRIESAIKTALVENNTIQPDGIGINCQGSGLTAIIRNNNISRPSGYFAGIFAGLDFGPLPQLTIQNNVVQNYFGIGLEVNSNNGNYNFNSFGGTNGAQDIRKISGNTPSATCNWFGSIDAAVVASKISGAVIYTPFLTSGFDNSAAVGFQPVNAACSGRNAYYVNNNIQAGDVFTSAIGNNSNNGSASAPFATISYALTQAAADDYIYVDAGTYTEQVTTDKGITIIGASQNLTSILKPAVTVAPPGLFPEQGVIQTAQSITGDVHISNLSVTGDYTVNVTPIIIQSGGSIKNCKLQSGNQGIFVRIDPAINLANKTVVVDGNTINAEYIAVNFAGTRLTATLSNNTLAVFNPGFSTAVFAGLDFGTLAGLTITGNTFSTYVSDGVMVNTNNGTISQNSFIGTGQKAINKIGGSTINATCNWYSSADANTVIPKITSGVNYFPWLVNGTDNNSAIGFQSVPGSCTGRQNKFYVNDNNTTNDVYTTAVGNNANAGTKSAPVLTVTYAISLAQPGDTIIVDAGIYPERILVSKSLYFKGAFSGVNPGSSLNRGASETILLPSAENNLLEIITVQASNVTFDGFLFDGDNPAITGSITLNGVDVNAGMGIYNGNLQTDSLLVKNNIFKNFFRYGLLLQKTTTAITGLTISQNRFDNVPSRSPRDGRAVGLFNNAYATVINNNITRVNTGVIIANLNIGSIDSFLIKDNIIEAYSFGINAQSNSNLTSSITANNNQITVANLASWNAPGSSPVNNSTGINMSFMTSTKNIVLSNNTITGTRSGIGASQFTSTGQLLLENNIVTGTQTGIQMSSINTALPASVNGDVVSNSSQLGLFYIGNGTATDKLSLNNVSLTNNVVGMDVSAVGGNLQMEFTGVAINGGTTGIRFYGTQLSLPGNILSGVSFANQTKEYILQTSKSFEGQTIDASTVSFDGMIPMNMTLAQLFATEDKLTHKMDFDSVGYFKLKPTEVFLTTNSFAADLPPVFGVPTTTPEISRAIGCAATGDIIHVNAGTYITSDFTLDKSITILGTNYLTSPNDPANKLQLNPVRNAESIIKGATINIAASNISLQGLSFDPGNKVALSLNFNVASAMNYGDFSLSRNRFKINSNLSQIILIGIGTATTSPSALINKGFDIQENRFEKNAPSTGIGNTFSIHNLKNLTINNNSFVVTVTDGSRIQSAIPIGNNGVVDSIVITNNLFDRHSNAITGNRFANALISHNTMSNCLRALNLVTTMPESSNVEFSNNIVETTTGGGGFIGSNRSGTSLPGTFNILKVENNIFTGIAIPAVPLQLFGSMNFTVSNSVLNPSFLIRGNKINYSGDFSLISNEFIRPITVRGNVAELTLEGNEIVLNNTGSSLYPAVVTALPPNPAFTINTDFVATAYMPATAVINIRNNKVQGFKQSVVFYDATTSGRDSYQGYGNIPAGAVVNINNNSFTGDSISINNGTVGEIVEATCNWYGATASHNITPKITETTVNHSPWLTNGTDNDVATGFQPVVNSCNGVPVDADIILVTNVTCNGAANGAIDVLVEDGLAPFTYAWSKDGVAGFSTLEDLTNLAPGDYKLIVTDANGSIDSVFTSITEPDVLTAAATGTNNICFGASAGTATVSTLGGTEPYAYLWSNNETTEDISNLIAGIYSVTVTDANGCTAITSYEVTHPTLLTAVATGTSTSCSNSATVTATGGTGSYTYLWSNNATTQTINSIPAGTYSVTVTDANSCTASASVTVTANEAFNPSAAVSNVSCSGGTNGSITITNVNATAPFSFSIDGVNFQAGTLPYTFNNLVAGTYTISVRDANGCTGFVTKTITQPPLLTVVLNNVQSTCFGLNTGVITVTATGGTGAFSYFWTGPNGFTSSQRNINNLATGNYSLTVTDNNNCTAVLNVVVPSLNEITVSAIVTNVLCRGTLTGAINLTVSGGSNSGFTFSWTGGTTSTGEDLSNLGFGNYNVSITDIGSGCVITRSYSISQPATNLALSATKTNATGCNSLGTITATGSGGTSPYQYKLDNGSYQTSGSFIGLYAGNFTVWVKDANGCTKSTVVSITDNGSDAYESNNSKNNAKAITIGTVINARIALATDVADWFKFTTPAGNGNYTMTFTHPTVTFTFNLYTAGNNVPALVPVSTSPTSKEYVLVGNTTYFISITGGLSYTCYNLSIMPPAAPITRNNNKSIEVKPMLEANLSALAYPNPHKGSFNIRIISPEEGIAKVELFAANGQKLAERNVAVNAGENNNVLFTGIKQGTVFYRVQIGKQMANGKVVGIE